MLAELCHAMIVSSRALSSYNTWTRMELGSTEDWSSDDQTLQERLRVQGCGLLEISENSTVQFIHQAVKDFSVNVRLQ